MNADYQDVKYKELAEKIIKVFFKVCTRLSYDDLVKSLKGRIPVIPAKAGIQLFQILKNSLDSGFHRSDDFLHEHQLWVSEIVYLR
jgi:hypothetical protein